jgi:hypothetical protein
MATRTIQGDCVASMCVKISNSGGDWSGGSNARVHGWVERMKPPCFIHGNRNALLAQVRRYNSSAKNIGSARVIRPMSLVGCETTLPSIAGSGGPSPLAHTTWMCGAVADLRGRTASKSSAPRDQIGFSKCMTMTSSGAVISP